MDLLADNSDVTVTAGLFCSWEAACCRGSPSFPLLFVPSPTWALHPPCPCRGHCRAAPPWRPCCDSPWAAGSSGTSAGSPPARQPVLDWHTVFTRWGFVVWVFFFFSFVSLQLLVLKPPALRQLSEGEKKREREGEKREKD